ncbi:MAG TPA: hypothetical protein VMD59_23000 [Acidimicrobiales bacterium]|nr:hypothetical protein [Acidimicrobiales bacterium]
MWFSDRVSADYSANQPGASPVDDPDQLAHLGESSDRRLDLSASRNDGHLPRDAKCCQIQSISRSESERASLVLAETLATFAGCCPRSAEVS